MNETRRDDDFDVGVEADIRQSDGIGAVILRRRYRFDDSKS